MISKKPGSLAFIICLLGASFYMYEFMLQVSLGVMTHELMRDLQLNAASLGIVSAFYFYAYMPMQIPAGLLHDKVGPRLALTLAIFICALGALGFSVSHNMWQASSGRFLMGIGSAFSFSGALMLISRWFPPQQFAILAGFVQLMSSVGAIAGELPLALAIRRWEWRPTMFFLFIVGSLLAVLVWFIVRDYPRHIQPKTAHVDNKEGPGLKDVFAKSQPWWVAIYSFLVWAPIAAFAGLWGIPFLVVSYQMSTEAASLACAAIWIGIGIGSPLMGWISEQIERRNVLLCACSLFGIVGSLAVIYLHLPLLFLYISLFLLGCAGCGQSLAFSVVRDVNHPRLMGAAIGLNNMATVAGGAILQPLIGYLLYYYWQGEMANNTPLYSVQDYRLALLMIPACYVLAVLVSLFCIRETYCKHKYAL